MAFVRPSKYRHVFGQAYKKDQCYDSIRVSTNNWDGSFCAVNPKFLAICTQAAGGGSFLVLKHEEVGRVDINHPQVTGHKGVVLDLAWNPFNDNMIATGSEDMSVKVWNIPEEGVVEENITEPLCSLEYHQKRVGQVVWHPTAEHILLSVGADNVIAIWNLDDGSVVKEIKCFTDTIFWASFNYNGSLIATTCKDKKIRIIDPRTGEIKKEGDGHEGAKVSRVQFLKNGKLFTTGFSRMSERQYGVFDGDSLKQLSLESIDSNNAPLTIYYDPDISLIYLVGKGDTLIRYYEVSDVAPYAYWLSNFSAKDPQRCVGFLPKRALNVNTCEVGRIYRVMQKGYCEPTPMIVPRKSDLFQDDIYPDTAGPEASLTAEEWLAGKNKDPILISLKEGYKSTRARSEVKSGGLGGGGGLKSGGGLGKGSGGVKSTPAAAPAAAKTTTSTAKSSPAVNTNGSSSQVADSPPSKEEEKPAITTPKPEPVSDKPKVEHKQQEDHGVQGVLSDLTSTVTKHEARIAALEELNHGQKSDINELRAEVDKLRELVDKQEKRIATLESKVNN